MDNEQPDTRFRLSVDGRDVIATAGGALMLVGAAAFHWGAALFVAGAALAVLAYRLSR